jgi:mannosyltransferase OCH1-like enzyme
MSIPKIIHQTYKNYNLPEIYQLCQNIIKKLHPDFEYRFYTDNDMDKIMKSEFLEYYTHFNALPRMIMKIDMFRYFLMYKYGGLYIDMDYLMFKPFNLTDYNVVLPCSREQEDGQPTCLGNCIFASKAGHPFWKSLIDTLFNVNRSNLDYKLDKFVMGDPLGTGPGFVYNMWIEYIKKENNNDIYVPKREIFHPLSKKDNNYIDELKKKQISYGMHICTGLWTNQKL